MRSAHQNTNNRNRHSMTAPPLAQIGVRPTRRLSPGSIPPRQRRSRKIASGAGRRQLSPRSARARRGGQRPPPQAHSTGPSLRLEAAAKLSNPFHLEQFEAPQSSSLAHELSE